MLLTRSHPTIIVREGSFAQGNTENDVPVFRTEPLTLAAQPRRGTVMARLWPTGDLSGQRRGLKNCL
jgi:hypothetical protein